MLWAQKTPHFDHKQNWIYPFWSLALKVKWHNVQLLWSHHCSKVQMQTASKTACKICFCWQKHSFWLLVQSFCSLWFTKLREISQCFLWKKCVTHKCKTHVGSCWLQTKSKWSFTVACEQDDCLPIWGILIQFTACHTWDKWAQCSCTCAQKFFIKPIAALQRSPLASY